MNKYLSLLFLIFLFACGGSDEGGMDSTSNSVEELRSEQAKVAQEKLSALEEQVEADTARADFQVRQKLLVAYANYANNFNDDPLTPEYLFRAAKLANEMGKSRRAIEYLINLHDGFPTYGKRTEAAFLVGFIYENVLNDRIRAQEAYEKVIEFYPESTWASEAQASIELLYLTDEEKIAKFKKQNQAQ